MDQLLSTAAEPSKGQTELQRRGDLEVRILMLKRVLDDVRQMRESQRSYFRSRSSSVLRRCKRQEDSVDAQLTVVFQVPGLFDPIVVHNDLTDEHLVLGRNIVPGVLLGEQLCGAKTEFPMDLTPEGDPWPDGPTNGTLGAGN